MAEAKYPAAGERFADTNQNIVLWLANEQTDTRVGGPDSKETTKGFKRGGGFSGTALNATYVMKRLTSAFGPLGKGWGYKVVAENFVPGGPIIDHDGQIIGNEVVHVLRVECWWRDAETNERCSAEQFGQTTFVTKRDVKEGGRVVRITTATDEEAPKKSLTDAITKWASWLGIGADIHLGQWDDSRYVDAVREAEAERQREEVLSKSPFVWTRMVNGEPDTRRFLDAREWVAFWLQGNASLKAEKSRDVIASVWAQNDNLIAEVARANHKAADAVLSDLRLVCGVPAPPAPLEEFEVIDTEARVRKVRGFLAWLDGYRRAVDEMADEPRILRSFETAMAPYMDKMKARNQMVANRAEDHLAAALARGDAAPQDDQQDDGQSARA